MGAIPRLPLFLLTNFEGPNTCDNYPPCVFKLYELLYAYYMLYVCYSHIKIRIWLI